MSKLQQYQIEELKAFDKDDNAIVEYVLHLTLNEKIDLLSIVLIKQGTQGSPEEIQAMARLDIVSNPNGFATRFYERELSKYL